MNGYQIACDDAFKIIEDDLKSENNYVIYFATEQTNTKKVLYICTPKNLVKNKGKIKSPKL